MRSELEIKRAHDILVAVNTGLAPAVPMDEKTREGIKTAAYVLCWVLGHDNDGAFAENMQQIEEALGCQVNDRSPN